MKRDPQRPQECPGRPQGQPEPPSPPSSSSPEPPLWIFGYGSLVWRPGFEFTSRKVGFIRGYSRRFWQGDTFHRGSEKAVSQGAAPGGRLWGGGLGRARLLTALPLLCPAARPGGDADGGWRGEYGAGWGLPGGLGHLMPPLGALGSWGPPGEVGWGLLDVSPFHHCPTLTSLLCPHYRRARGVSPTRSAGSRSLRRCST